MKKLAFVVLFVIPLCFVIACPRPSKPPSPDASDAKVGDVQVDRCTAMCAHLRDFKCRQGFLTTCESTCTREIDSGVFAPPPVDCIIASASKGDMMDRCNFPCPAQ